MRRLITLSAVAAAGLLAAASPAAAASKTFIVPDQSNGNQWLQHPQKFGWSVPERGMFGFATKVRWSDWGAAKVTGKGRTSLGFVASAQGRRAMAFTITASGRRRFGEGGEGPPTFVYCRVTLRGKFLLDEPGRTVSLKLDPPAIAACS